LSEATKWSQPESDPAADFANFAKMVADNAKMHAESVETFKSSERFKTAMETIAKNFRDPLPIKLEILKTEPTVFSDMGDFSDVDL
jgi:hypothetical protein